MLYRPHTLLSMLTTSLLVTLVSFGTSAHTDQAPTPQPTANDTNTSGGDDTPVEAPSQATTQGTQENTHDAPSTTKPTTQDAEPTDQQQAGPLSETVTSTTTNKADEDAKEEPGPSLPKTKSDSPQGSSNVGHSPVLPSATAVTITPAAESDTPPVSKGPAPDTPPSPATLPTNAEVIVDQGPPRVPMTQAEAKRILKRPRGSLSKGKTNGGELLSSYKLRSQHRHGYAFFPHIAERDTHYGTYEMKRFIARSGKRFKKVYRRSVIGVGNVSAKEGGKIKWSASHQTGRDVDFAMFALDHRGRSVNPKDYSYYDKDAKSRTGLVFDTKRNLALVRVLLTDPEYQVQWIFVARWLKSRMINEAKRQNLDPSLITRMQKVMKQPGDSAPHNDHFHVRLYCSIQDRLHGCRERGPVWPWVDRGDAVVDLQVDQLIDISHMKHAKLQHQAINAMRLIAAPSSAPALMHHLKHGGGAVRWAALSALEAVREPTSLPGLMDVMQTTKLDNLAFAVFKVVLRFPGVDRLQLAETMLMYPNELLSEDVLEAGIESTLLLATEVVARGGNERVVPVLVELLTSGNKSLRVAAQSALQEITSHAFDSDIGSRRAEEREAAIKAWRDFVENTGSGPWATWIRLGLAQAGYDLPDDVDTPEALETLIDATGDRRGRVSRNAVRLLSDLTGHVMDPYAMSTKRQHRHWKRWWAAQQRAAAGATQ